MVSSAEAANAFALSSHRSAGGYRHPHFEGEPADLGPGRCWICLPMPA